MNTLMQNLTGQELPGFEQADAHTQSVTAYVGEGGAGRRSQRSVGGDGEGARSKVEAEMHPSRPRPLTTSFLLDHNFPMDIPPPTDLLPEHVRTGVSNYLAYLLLPPPLTAYLHYLTINLSCVEILMFLAVCVCAVCVCSGVLLP